MFQDPYSALNPRMTIGSILSEPLKVHHQWPAEKRNARVAELLEIVGLARSTPTGSPRVLGWPAPARGIARPRPEPDLIVLDEPVSALDVSIQAGVVSLLSQLQRRDMGLAYVFIAHDLSVVRHISHRVR